MEKIQNLILSHTDFNYHHTLQEWKTKELLLLAKIGEDVKREARIEEQRRKNREESDRKVKWVFSFRWKIEVFLPILVKKK